MQEKKAFGGVNLLCCWRKAPTTTIFKVKPSEEKGINMESKVKADHESNKSRKKSKCSSQTLCQSEGHPSNLRY